VIGDTRIARCDEVADRQVRFTVASLQLLSQAMQPACLLRQHDVVAVAVRLPEPDDCLRLEPDLGHYLFEESLPVVEQLLGPHCRARCR